MVSRLHWDKRGYVCVRMHVCGRVLDEMSAGVKSNYWGWAITLAIEYKLVSTS